MEKMKVFICPECEQYMYEFKPVHTKEVWVRDQWDRGTTNQLVCNGELIECETIAYQDGPEQSQSSREWWDNVNNLQEDKKWIP